MSAELLNPPTPTFEHYGEPELWACPKCGEHVLVYQALPMEHVCCVPNVAHRVRQFFYYYELTETVRIRSLRLVGAIADDPLLGVFSRTPEGLDVPWARREENGELVFHPPPGMDAPDGHTMRYSPRLQVHEAIPRREMEKRATRGRHSA